MKKTTIISVSILVLSFILAIYFYPQMPEKMVSHWNTQGEVDGVLPKFWGLFLMPLISAGLLLLFWLIPKIDPLKANLKKFRKYFDGFVLLILGFLFYIYLLSIFWNIGLRFNMPQVLAPAFAALFYYLGILTEKAKRNWFVGIRNPWTLSNEKVWEKTHQISGKLFKITGGIALLTIFIPNYALYFILIPIISVSIFTFVYSFLVYQKEVR